MVVDKLVDEKVSFSTANKFGFSNPIVNHTETVQKYLLLKLLNFYLQLNILWYQILIYLCKYQQTTIEAILIHKTNRIFLKFLHLEIFRLMQITINSNFRKLQPYHFCNLIELKEYYFCVILSLKRETNFKVVQQ